MKSLIGFVRHGETDWNNLGLIQGSIDNPLNSNGVMQAHHVAEVLKKVDINWDIIISSPLSRAYDTAKIIQIYLGSIPVIKDKAFIEREFGEAEGTKVTQDIFDKIYQNAIIGQETNEDLMKRVMEGLDNLVQTYPSKNILIVAHSHVIKALLVQTNSAFTFSSPLANVSINYFSYENNLYTHLQK